MQQLLILLALVFLQLKCFCQEIPSLIVRDSAGIIKSFQIADSLSLSLTANDFFQKYLGTQKSDQFIKESRINSDVNSFDEHYNQYYNGIPVLYGNYNIHYRKGKIVLLNGNYIKINDLDSKPLLSQDQVKTNFASYQNIPLDSISDFNAELMIALMQSKLGNKSPKLVFRVSLTSGQINNTKVGYVDAHDGNILKIEPLFYNSSAIGTFSTTRYSGTQQANTQYYNHKYYLVDSTRAAIFHTWNANNGTDILAAQEIQDNDNLWTTAEFHPNNIDMGLDVHWAFQKIYDHLLNRYGIISFNNHIPYSPITGYIRYGSTPPVKDNSGWTPSGHYMYFGEGAVAYRPLASLDNVAHEYGHGITNLQINWDGFSPPQNAFNEGLSDIWAAIMEYRIRPNQVWKIGEQLDLRYGCMRNFQNTNDTNARFPIANTCGSTQWNQTLDAYVRSGIFSHWFYLLVNGGSGTNDIGNSYLTYGLGMNTAEDIIEYSIFNHFLDNTVTTYDNIKDQILTAVAQKYGYSTLEAQQVSNAWYAVGVGSQQPQLNITGPWLLCFTSTPYTLNNIPAKCSIIWNCSSNISRVSAQGANPCYFLTSISGSGWIQAKVISQGGDTVVVQKNVWAGVFNNTWVTGEVRVCPNSLYTYTAQVPGGHQPVYSYSWTYPSGWYNNGQVQNMINLQTPQYNMQYGAVRVSITNACGTSAYSGVTVYPGSCPHNLILSPNPASDMVNVTIIPARAASNDSTAAISANTTVGTNTIYKVTVTDLMGISYLNVTKYTASFVLPVQSLPNGNYFIIVDDGVTRYYSQLVVKH